MSAVLTIINKYGKQKYNTHRIRSTHRITSEVRHKESAFKSHRQLKEPVAKEGNKF